jgi:hypothetical protein
MISILIKNSYGGSYIDLLDIFVKLINNNIDVKLYIVYDFIDEKDILENLNFNFINDRYNLLYNFKNNIKFIFKEKLLFNRFDKLLTTFDIFYKYNLKLFNKLYLLATNIAIDNNNKIEFLYDKSYKYLEEKINILKINKNKIFIYNENKDLYYISNYIKKININDLKINNNFENNYYINFSNFEINQKDFQNNIWPKIENNNTVIQLKSYKLDFLNNYSNIKIMNNFIPNIINLYDKLIYWADKDIKDNTCRNLIESYLLNKKIIYLNFYNNKDGAYNRYQDICNNKYNDIKQKYILTMNDDLIKDMIK